MQAQIEACQESMRAAQRIGEEDLKKHAQEVQATRTEHEKDKANMADEVSGRHQTLGSKAIRLSVLMHASSVSMHVRCGCMAVPVHDVRLDTLCHCCDACKDQPCLLQ